MSARVLRQSARCGRRGSQNRDGFTRKSDVRKSGSRLLLSGVDLARLLGITDRQVRRLAARGVLPRAGRKFDAFECGPRFTKYMRSGVGSSVDLSEARLKLTDAQRHDLELRTRSRERQLLDRDEVAACFDAAMVTIGSQLDGLAGRLCGELATVTEPAVIRARLFEETRRIRNAAADQLEALARGTAGSDDAAGAKSGPAE